MNSSFKTTLGFANLPNQVHRKSVKKGFEFTILVVGESGLGKRTLMNSLFSNQLVKEKIITSNNTVNSNLNCDNEFKSIPLAELINKSIDIKTSTFDIEESGVKLRLTVVNTPGYGEAIDNTDCLKPIIDYINEQFDRYYHYETGLNRKQIVDNRIHCCFYFISPISYGLKPLDIYFMKSLHDKVNIIPIIGRADALTVSEMTKLKRNIMEDIKSNGIKIYQPPESDEDEEEEEYKNFIKDIRTSIPFAISSSVELHDNKTGKMTKGRQYPWGLVETENYLHSDFVKLRSLIVTNMQEMRELTHDLHYENYRAARIVNRKVNGQNGEKISLNEDDVDEAEKKRRLMETEAELKRVQEMYEILKEQMKTQQIKSESSSLNGTITSTDD